MNFDRMSSLNTDTTLYHDNNFSDEYFNLDASNNQNDINNGNVKNEEKKQEDIKEIFTPLINQHLQIHGDQYNQNEIKINDTVKQISKVFQKTSSKNPSPLGNYFINLGKGLVIYIKEKYIK